MFFKRDKKRIFLDYASITPLDKDVALEMSKIQQDFWANPSSLHSEGEIAKAKLEEARSGIAKILHAKSSEIFFTSGGTESLNIAILGVVKAYKNEYKKVPHIIVSSIEHPAVLEPIKNLLKNGEVEVTFVSPNESGIVSPKTIESEIKDETVLIVVQHSNNEIGTIQPISKISSLIKEYKNKFGAKRAYPYLLVDASQSVLYENVSLERLQSDIIVLDGIKMYGPRGAGVLLMRHGVKISPTIFGGGQENGLRSGTENVANAWGLLKALEIAVSLRESESKRLKDIRDYAINKITKEIDGATLNGSQEYRLPNNVNICFDKEHIDSEFLVIKLDTLGFAVSAASACHALSLENSSYVVASLGNKRCASRSLRFTFGRDTKKSDIDKLLDALKILF